MDIIEIEHDDHERPGDYRKPNRRPQDKPFISSTPDDSAWMNWVMFEMSVRLGHVTRTGEAVASPGSAVNVEHLFDAFLDEFDRMREAEVASQS